MKLMSSQYLNLPLFASIIAVSCWSFILSLSGTQACPLTVSFKEHEEMELRELQYPMAAFANAPSTYTKAIKVLEGSSYVIRCECVSSSASGPPPTWHPVAGPIAAGNASINKKEEANYEQDANQSVVVYDDNSWNRYSDLYLYNVREPLTGSYQCASDTDKKLIQIIIGNPSVIMFTTQVTGAMNDVSNFFIEVSLTGDPVPLIQDTNWYFNDQPIQIGQTSSTGVRIQETSEETTFLFTFVSYSTKHTGRYTFVANTPAGTANDSFYLHVFTFPMVTFTPYCIHCLKKGDNILIKAGETLTLSCRANTTYPAPYFTWFRNETENPAKALIPGEHWTIIQTSDFESRLILESIQLSDADTYYCKANNTYFKDIKGVAVTIEYLPNVHPISPSTIQIPAGEDLQLLVSLDGWGYPMPLQITWTNDTSQSSMVEDSRIIFNGANLTVKNVTMSDGGSYTLTVGNSLEQIQLHFNITVTVPPALSVLSNTTVYSAVGGVASFQVKVTGTLYINDISWSGNFKEDQQNVTLKENGVITLVLNDLDISDSGDALLAVEIEGHKLMQVFHLIVLNTPAVPNPVAIVQCSLFVEITWRTATPTPITALTDEVIIEQRACSFDDLFCHEQWVELGRFHSDTESLTLTHLSPNQYSFRLTSCNLSIGCGESLVIGTEVKPGVQELMKPMIVNASSQSINSSSFLLSWNEGSLNECSELVLFDVTCHSTIDYTSQNFTTPASVDHRYVNLTVTAAASMSHPSHYSVILSHLNTDSEYNCSVLPFYHNSFDTRPQPDVNKLVNIIGYTYPNHPPTDLITQLRFTITTDGLSTLGTLLLTNLGTLKLLAELKDTVGFIQLAVLRLGGSSTLPSDSPDVLYKSIKDFGTYAPVHSETNEGDAVFKPYIAAEFVYNDIPDEFLIGGGAVDSYNTVNGPLYLSDYYTVFVRFYSKSRFGKQYSVFVSSLFSSPSKPWIHPIAIGTSDKAVGGDSSSIIALVFTSVGGLLIAVILVSIVLYIAKKTSCIKRLKRNRFA